MFDTIELPTWFVAVAAVFASIAAIERALIPSVRWFFRRRMERVVAKVNQRLDRPIEPFKLARRHDMIQRLLYHPDVMQAVNEYAKSESIPENVAFQKATKYAREIVPSFSATAYFTIAVNLARFLCQSMYKVSISQFNEVLNQIEGDATVVFVMNHRSNMDYILFGYLAAKRSALSYAVGEWARVWPLSWLIRALGAFFIRRKSEGLLYRRVLARYVQMATQGGVTQAVFPEGGLSLNGRLGAPRLGLLNYVMSGWTSDGPDVVFIPVAINYDRVLEDNILGKAHKRGKRRFGVNIFLLFKFMTNQIWLRLTAQNKRLGNAAVSFGVPLSLNDFHSQKKEISIVDVGTEILSRIALVMPVLPVPLIAAILINHAPLSAVELKSKVNDLMKDLEQNIINPTQTEATCILEEGINNLQERQLIELGPKGYTISEKGRQVIPFYAASIEHLIGKSKEL